MEPQDTPKDLVVSFSLFFLQLNDQDENYSLKISYKPLGVTTSNTVR